MGATARHARPEVTGYTHFFARVNCPVADGPAGMTGIVERLGTGEKRAFGSGDELLRFMCEWSAESFGPSPAPSS